MVSEEKNPCFAVCLAAYNGMAFMVEQIESILQQKGVDIQVFISVDQSTDGTENRLAEWALSESRLTLLPFGGAAHQTFHRQQRERGEDADLVRGSTYVLIAIVKKELQLNASLYSLLQILSVSVFEKTQLSQAFAGSELFQNQTDFSNQLNLFDS